VTLVQRSYPDDNQTAIDFRNALRDDGHDFDEVQAVGVARLLGVWLAE
jgi:hypothetical protein